MNDLDENFENFIKKLQQEIDEEESKIFSKRVIDLYHNPKNWGKMDNPTVEEKLLGPCGDTMQFFMKINGNDDVIEKISFLTDGCGPSVASGSQTTIFVEKKRVIEALKINPEDILKELGRLPEEHLHCPVLAINALRKGLNKYLQNKH
jgi:nitrogen fixation NifU-like protein